MDDTMAIALFRHGLTEANKHHAYLGWTDSPLCSIEKEKLAEVPARYKILQSSDLGRCLETAKLLFPGAAPEIRPEWRELHFGEWENKTFEDLKNDPRFQEWLQNPFGGKPPEGEAFSEFTARIDMAWEKLIIRVLESNIKKAAIVTHGGVIRYLLTRFAPEAKDFWEWKVSFGKGCELVWPAAKLGRGERCILLREVHLTGNPSG